MTVANSVIERVEVAREIERLFHERRDLRESVGSELPVDIGRFNLLPEGQRLPPADSPLSEHGNDEASEPTEAIVHVDVVRNQEISGVCRFLLDGLPPFFVCQKFSHIVGLLNALYAAVGLSCRFALLAAARLVWRARVLRSANLRYYGWLIPDCEITDPAGHSVSMTTSEWRRGSLETPLAETEALRHS